MIDIVVSSIESFIADKERMDRDIYTLALFSDPIGPKQRGWILQI